MGSTSVGTASRGSATSGVGTAETASVAAEVSGGTSDSGLDADTASGTGEGSSVAACVETEGVEDAAAAGASAGFDQLQNDRGPDRN